ncbi:c-5 sterol desaturase [Moniliophthora roreri]|nr:c-5 sterol desaturase [Moniliophthora roreri]
MAMVSSSVVPEVIAWKDTPLSEYSVDRMHMSYITITSRCLP